ncbi:MAG: hypothetical protein RBR73_01130, partial [Halothiobacillaceae bacterium]|nr:hypothetical protein [Halothiobacillaceae bacterium]
QDAQHPVAAGLKGPSMALSPGLRNPFHGASKGAGDPSSGVELSAKASFFKHPLRCVVTMLVTRQEEKHDDGAAKVVSISC